MKAYVHYLQRDERSGDVLGMDPVARITLPDSTPDAVHRAIESVQNYDGSWSLKLGKDANPLVEVLGDLHLRTSMDGVTSLQGIRSSTSFDAIAIIKDQAAGDIEWFEMDPLAGFSDMRHSMIKQFNLPMNDHDPNGGLSKLRPKPLTALAHIATLSGMACIEEERQLDKSFGGIQSHPLYKELASYLNDRVGLAESDLPKDVLVNLLLDKCQTNYEIMHTEIIQDDGWIISQFAEDFAKNFHNLSYQAGNTLIELNSPEYHLLQSSGVLNNLLDKGNTLITDERSPQNLSAADPLSDANAALNKMPNPFL